METVRNNVTSNLRHLISKIDKVDKIEICHFGDFSKIKLVSITELEEYILHQNGDTIKELSFMHTINKSSL